jgi:dienelactone hydrolase
MRTARLLTTILTSGAALAAAVTPDQLRQWRERIVETLFVPEPPPALSPVSYGAFEPTPGVIAERITYSTQFDMRIPAILYRPAKSGARKAPAIVVVNGHGGDKYAWYSFYTGMLYAKAGTFVIAYDPIGEGERNSERKSVTRRHDANVPPEEMGRRMAGLMINDVRQAVAYLSQRPEVDSTRIAAVGYSMGSFVLGITCAIEPRLNSCVLVGGGNLGGPGCYWDRSNHTMCQAIPYKSLLVLGDRGAVLYSLHAARGRTFIFNGTADRVVATEPLGPQGFFEDLRKRVIALSGSDRNVFESVLEPGAGHRPFFVTRPVARWLARQLRFPNWTEAEIDAMPETHIGPWAGREGVYIEPVYNTEEREAGTRALGSRIPGVPREQLHVVPLKEWEHDRDRYVYEAWIARAKALVKE